jgi:glycosyltransferase involved in cell wall biosynthesis
MLTLALPLGNTFGWGICGKNLARELARLSPVRLVTRPFEAQDIGDELEYVELRRIFADRDAARVPASDGPVLQAITGPDLLPMAPEIRGRRNVGYAFIEQSILPETSLGNARGHFDLVIAGSTWCQDVLRARGLEQTAVVLQGVDPAIFNMYENRKTFFQDRFVVFSGGKFEFRKGQDVVIRAFRVLQERHDDVLLVNAWFNHWEDSVRTMAGSPHIEFAYQGGEHCAAINHLLSANGIDLTKVITLPAKPQLSMARIYKNSDCGLFPNRCEGGTNLALMEYMACGKPAIVSNSSGHRDVANDANALLLKNLQPLTVSMGGEAAAVWDDPSLDEAVEALEWAYQHREALHDIGEAAGWSMQEFTWTASAARFHELLTA